MQIPSLTRCCFCVPLRYGLLTWAYLRLILTIFVTGSTLLALSVQIFFIFIEVTTSNQMLIMFPLLLFLFDIVFNFVLIVGCHKKHLPLLRLYFWFGKVYAFVFVLLCVIINSLILAAASKTNSNARMTKARYFITIFLCICCTVLVLHMYLMLLVRSEISRLDKPSNQFQLPEFTAVQPRAKQVDSIPTKEKNFIV